MQFNVLIDQILEALQGVDPAHVDRLISNSFKDVVISDLLAQASVESTPIEILTAETTHGNLVDAKVVIEKLFKEVPELFDNDITFDIKPEHTRVSLDFDNHGNPTIIRMPEHVNKDLGPVIVLHEMSHVMYSIDIITNNLLNHPHSAQAFTLARTLEDVRTETLMEKDYPATATVFKSRAQYIIPIYKKHSPTAFSKIVDSLFLNLRGYSNKFNYDNKILKIAQKFVSTGNDREKKVKIILELTDEIFNTLQKSA